MMGRSSLRSLQPKPEKNVLQGMEYRGIRYIIRARIEREQWSVAIHPAGVEMKEKVVIGSRSGAELQARALIDSWLKKPRKVLRASSRVSS